MNKKYFLALANIALLIPLVLFAWDKYFTTKQYYAELELEFDLVNAFISMKYSLLILFVGILSLVGILFWTQKKVFFFISSFFGAALLVLLLLVQSLSIVRIITILSEVVFVWLLVWRNTFSVYENRRGFKWMIFMISALSYLCLLQMS